MHEFMMNELHSLADVQRLPYRQAASQHDKKFPTNTSRKNEMRLTMVHAT